MSLFPSILKLDARGYPVSWLNWQQAVNLYVRDLVAWEMGERAFEILGGYSRIDASRSKVTINSIIAIKGKSQNKHFFSSTPALTNRELFRRDGHLCLYCGRQHPESLLTRDHVVPRSLGGRDNWKNVVTACRRCNVAKGGKTPEQANMQLLAVPFMPNRAEYLALKNRRILADQMDFLKKQFNHQQLMNLALN